ncbi:MAG: hypothetical protein AAF547_12455 [Actinomycetota bacterium]
MSLDLAANAADSTCCSPDWLNWPETLPGWLVLLLGAVVFLWIVARGLQSIGGSMDKWLRPNFWLLIGGIVAVCVGVATGVT